MVILLLNCGSSTLKFQVRRGAEEVLAHGTIEGIGKDKPGLDYAGAVARVLDGLPSDVRPQIRAVGHRVVHGGEQFRDAAILDDATIQKIESLDSFAPLHNARSVEAIRAAQRLLPGAQQVAAFDTVFHQTLPEAAYLYGLPYEQYERYRLRRYGFHGLSYRYAMERFAQIHGRTPSDSRLIVCHLGNGCSVCAIDRGCSVETTMGLTPLEGLVMGTRVGDLDASVVLFLLEQEHLSPDDVRTLLNRKSGLLGLSGRSNDTRELLQAREKGDAAAARALAVFVHRVRKAIGAYFALLNGADAIVFTGGIGEHAAPLRAEICHNMDALGVQWDGARNAALSGEGEVTLSGSRTSIWVIPADEETIIARDTLRVLGASG